MHTRCTARRKRALSATRGKNISQGRDYGRSYETAEGFVRLARLRRDSVTPAVGQSDVDHRRLGGKPSSCEGCGASTHDVTGQKDGIPIYGGLGLAAGGVRVDQADLDVLVITARRAPAHLVKSLFCCCLPAGWSFRTPAGIA